MKPFIHSSTVFVFHDKKLDKSYCYQVIRETEKLIWVQLTENIEVTNFDGGKGELPLSGKYRGKPLLKKAFYDNDGVYIKTNHGVARLWSSLWS